MKTLNELFRMVILANELSNSPKLAYEFSDPDGIRSGKSGWSFGVCQFDTRNNNAALACLAECGFSSDEIHGIVDQTIDVKPFSARLRENAEIIARYDMAQLDQCIFAAINFCNNYSIPVTDTSAILALADTVNQYGSLGNGSAAYLRKIEHPITANDILHMKLTWKYATASKRGYDDTVRRVDNITNICRQGVSNG